MKRKIITINEDLCNSCGECVTSCHEGALQIVNGKAKLVRDDFCDGLGACIGECPTGALKIEEKESEAFDPQAVEQAKALAAHAPTAACGCPGSQIRHVTNNQAASQQIVNGSSLPEQVNPSDLRQWPVQLHLVNPNAPYFKNAELVVLSTCSPIASADIHWRFIRGRAVVVACPKLDNTDGYVEKLAEIIRVGHTPKVIVVIMEVPCCQGLSQMVQEAISVSGEKKICFEEVAVGLDGKIKNNE